MKLTYRKTQNDDLAAYEIEDVDETLVGLIYNDLSEADAEMYTKTIVKAVNSHEKLKGALIEIQKQFNKNGNMTGHLFDICENALKSCE